MPTYDYKCDACGYEFEKFQSMSSDRIKKCPKCGKNKVQRLIGTGAGLIFKGSGFYITDYRDSGYKDQAKADAPPSAETPKGKDESAATPTAATGDTSSGGDKPAAESKPAAKAEPKPAGKSDRLPTKSSKKSD